VISTRTSLDTLFRRVRDEKDGNHSKNVKHCRSRSMNSMCRLEHSLSAPILRILPLLCAPEQDAELCFRRAVAHRHGGEPGEAEQCWRRILSLSRPRKFARMDEGIYAHSTRRNLAAFAWEGGDAEEEERQWRAVLAERPGDAVAKISRDPLADPEFA
jgi:hypothetical protein